MDRKIALEVKAEDNHGNLYEVELVRPEFQPGESWDSVQKKLMRMPNTYGWVLRVKDTPGRWYMKTLLADSFSGTISIDYGQRWSCVNFREIMDAAVLALAVQS